MTIWSEQKRDMTFDSRRQFYSGWPTPGKRISGNWDWTQSPHWDLVQPGLGHETYAKISDLLIQDVGIDHEEADRTCYD